MKENNFSFSKGDPGIILELDDLAISRLNPGVSVAQSRAQLIAAITDAGMAEAHRADGTGSGIFSFGTEDAFVRAHNALWDIPWARRQAQLPDVGDFWRVTGNPANPTFNPMLTPFN